MNRAHIILLFFLFGLFSFNLSASAQMSRANTLYTQGRYIDAAKAFEKIVKKESTNYEAISKLASCYRILKDYTKAEEYYAKAVNLPNADAEQHLLYGQALKSNKKFAEAKEQFELYVQKKPSSLLGKLLLQSINDVKTWESEPAWFTVSRQDDLNSEWADFSPTVINNSVVFTTEREEDYVNENQNGANHKPYLTLFSAKANDNDFRSFSKPKRFASSLKSPYHDGPASFSKTSNVLYFSRSARELKGNKENKIKIYYANNTGKSWTKPYPFPYNSNEYNTAHPAISEDGKLLFFASDMPGGLGGMDIYMCRWENNQWTKPQNLGNGVNSSQDEVFPSFRNGELYFSSNGLPGYGGLDIFVSKLIDNFETSINFRTPLNSNTDDFGICWIDDKNGFFSSDRNGGLGGDDIYRFNFLGIKTVEKTSMQGLLEYQQLPISGMTVKLLDENDNVLQVTKTDNSGKFTFDKLNADQKYMVLVDTKDEGVLTNGKVYLTNKNGEKVLLANKIKSGVFTFQALPADRYAQMPILQEKDESLFTIGLYGQVYQQLPGDFNKQMELYVVDDDGKIVATTRTDKDGKFYFPKLSPDAKYFFRTEEEDGSLKIVMLTENGEILESTSKKGKDYVYVRLDPDKKSITLLNEEDVVIRIKVNENFIISNIYYDYDKSDINPAAAKELDKLVTILKKNKHIAVELSSHTDSRASDDYNLKLSQKRADAAAEYIISKGIEKKRIFGKGYGETRLMNKCSNGIECTEEEHGKNRRTEFKVIALQ
ncbi:MAG: OmpA family protein [Bacteroidetes bacterium]|nr:hypothetical protein [Bacteroidota bacterium]MBV6461088.1 hypothetical protein [Flavobacteriales bacterium]WKZ75515.1 MAG: OmpA family protein [Vicingaceae bacterium]MCL4815082.1 OmpA family protein [Flavobacteriales bacterium]NOG94811.1 OmpA family protein [Bacteroidota bacterium]